MLATLDDIGHALTSEEEAAVLSACLPSRSGSPYPAVMLALNTGMRYDEIRLLLWKQLDFTGKMLTVGKSKTRAGTGRVLPLNARILNVLEMWAAQFPDREPTHYVFPFEKCGAKGEEGTFGFTAGVIFYGTEPTRPIGNWKEAWEKGQRARGGHSQRKQGGDQRNPADAGIRACHEAKLQKEINREEAQNGITQLPLP